MPNPDTFTIGLIQMHCSPDPDDNLHRAVEKVRSAAKQGAHMICLPELFRAQEFPPYEVIDRGRTFILGKVVH